MNIHMHTYINVDMCMREFDSLSAHVLVPGLLLHDIELLDYFNQNIPAIQTFKEELNRMSIQCSQYTSLDVLRESMLLFHRLVIDINMRWRTISCLSSLKM